MKLTIDRSKWLRGEPNESCLLRRADGKMCCLGFYALACGVSKDDIEGVCVPLSLKLVSGLTLPYMVKNPYEYDQDAWEHTKLANDLMRANDTKQNLQLGCERELKIKTLFATIGVEVEYV